MYDFHDKDGRWQQQPGIELDGLHEDERVSYTMGEMADKASFTAQTSHSVDLDYSVASLGAVEQILTLMHDRHVAEPGLHDRNEMFREALPWGAYLGEVIRLAYGGKWIARHTNPQYGEGFFLNLHGVTMAPVDKAHKRLELGAEHSVIAFHGTLEELLKKKGKLD